MNSIFKEKFEFTYNYFTVLLDLVKQNKRNFPQALVFEGSDTITQYLFALELARILNCKNDGDDDCDCINCKWIKTHSHPCVQNISQIHFKGENDETKTVISAKQARAIEASLSLSSDYHRFFIFFSSKEKTYQNNELKDFERLNYSNDINFAISPLDYSTFHPTVPNALLKSIEEPPEKTTFVFLTKSKEDILPTIVSRCLVFKFSGNRLMNDNQDTMKLFVQYPDINFDNCLDISENILSYIKETNTTFLDILNAFLEYLLLLLKQNINNAAFYNKVDNDIKMINHAIKQSKANMQDKVVIESLMLKIARGY